MKKRVLLVGSNPTLLDTRQHVLEANGIASGTRLVEAVPPGFLDSTEAALVVACSSLSMEAKRSLIHSAHSARPRVRCLVVEPDSNLLTTTPDADASVWSLDGPQIFVSCVRDLIQAD